MSTTLSPPRVTPQSSNGIRSSTGAGATARRNRTRIAVGLVVIVLCVLATASLFSSAERRLAVIAVRRSVPAGHKIDAADLTTVRLSSGSGLRTVNASEGAHLVGQVAAVSLVAGSLLAPEQVSATPRVPAGMAIAGATLKGGQYPVTLEPGDTVLVVETPPPTTTGNASTPVDRGRATVLDVNDAKDGQGGLAVSLLVPTDGAENVASAGAAGRLSLVGVA